MQTTLTEEQFAEQYPLTVNHLDTNAAWDGYQFETYGAELQFVREQDPACIWTIMDDDNRNLRVASGYHFVNRIGYARTIFPTGARTAVCGRARRPHWINFRCAVHALA